MSYLTKIIGIFSGVLLFIYLEFNSNSDSDSVEFIALYFVISFYGTFENQLFYYFKRLNNVNNTSSKVSISRDNKISYLIVSLGVLMIFSLLYMLTNNVISITNLILLVILVLIKLFLNYFQIIYELIGHGERVFSIKHGVLLISLLVVIFYGENYEIESNKLLFYYFISSSLFSLFIVILLLYFDSNEKRKGVHILANDVKKQSYFQLKMLISSIAGYVGGQLLLINSQGIDILEFKYVSFLFIFGSSVIAVSSSKSVANRGNIEKKDACFFDKSFALTLLFYLMLLLSPLVAGLVKVLIIGSGFNIDQYIDVFNRVNFIYSYFGVTSILLMFTSSVILLQLIKVSLFFRKDMIELLFYSNIFIFILVSMLLFFQIAITPLGFLMIYLIINIAGYIDIKFSSFFRIKSL